MFTHQTHSSSKSKSKDIAFIKHYHKGCTSSLIALNQGIYIETFQINSRDIYIQFLLCTYHI